MEYIFDPQDVIEPVRHWRAETVVRQIDREPKVAFQQSLGERSARTGNKP